MVARSCRYYMLILISVHLLFFLVYSNNLLFQNCIFRRKVDQEKTIFEFNLQLKRNGDKIIDITEEEEGPPNRIVRLSSTKEDIETRKDDVERKEFIQEYRNGILQVDNTNIKQIKTKQSTDESQQELYKIGQNKINPRMARKKYIFSLRYYEQLSMATKNLLSLASLATHNNRHVVMPFVGASRFSGLRLGASMSRFKEAKRNNQTDLNREYKGNKFSEMSRYFDIQHLKNQMINHGYTSLASFNEFQKDCASLDVVIHFLYSGGNSVKEFGKWYKQPMDKYLHVKRKAKRNNGWIECNFVKRSQISQFLGNINVTKYICVDPEMINTAEKLENRILKDAQCVGVVLWKGDGERRTHFPLAPSIREPLRPSDLKHNKSLIDIAYSYIRDVIKRPFISVHVRSERHIIRKGVAAARDCIQKLSKEVQERKYKFKLTKVFLASDLEKYGSDTLLLHSNESDRDLLQKELLNNLNDPFTFNPNKYNLYDRGEIAIVEMHIISMGESLYTLGKGNFQEWIIDLFLSYNAEDRRLIYKVCELENK